jgi:7-keto-8-aminopelargonate synthetase-like enzyme
MDGSVADLRSLCNMADDHRALVVVDEAHGTGVFGEHGRGVCEMQGVEDRVSVRIGTLSKALGGLGGFVAGPTVVCDWLWNRARSQFFSTALPPAVCAAASAAIGVIRNEVDRRERLKARSTSFREMLRQFGLAVFPAPSESPIVGVLVEHDAKAVEASAQLLGRGIFAPAVRPPTVPPGTARLRFSVTCEHSESQLRHAANQLRHVLAAIS